MLFFHPLQFCSVLVCCFPWFGKYFFLEVLPTSPALKFLLALLCSPMLVYFPFLQLFFSSKVYQCQFCYISIVFVILHLCQLVGLSSILIAVLSNTCFVVNLTLIDCIFVDPTKLFDFYIIFKSLKQFLFNVNLSFSCLVGASHLLYICEIYGIFFYFQIYDQ